MRSPATPAQSRNKRFIESFVAEVSVFIKAFLFSRLIGSSTADLKEEKGCREKRPLPGFRPEMKIKLGFGPMGMIGAVRFARRDTDQR
jgi:hypothetical protein